MGRHVSVYGIDYAVMKDRLADALRAEPNRTLLASYAADSGLDVDALLDVLGTDPARMTIDQLDVVACAFEELRDKAGRYDSSLTTPRNDYFNFAWYCETFARLHATAGEHDEIYIYDSY
ncbi:hypothetical protein [Longimicrobium sp.]|uniref:hypothetical protein n=1 Tax=Longimicrobium sp. TaxID=2029185 RepID=UPI002E303795|nr:hypothetical protein [Longimicrobium sp.]HEX6041928.1 hypothetical protein [Longimicrobium sp.]